jgi:hypothetical protein
MPVYRYSEIVKLAKDRDSTLHDLAGCLTRIDNRAGKQARNRQRGRFEIRKPFSEASPGSRSD